MSAINYRNVSDYIAKSGMRRNCTWGTDVEIFAAALLFKTDIWVFSSDIGSKWMVFSGRGAKLTDALESPPKYCRINTLTIMELIMNQL